MRLEKFTVVDLCLHTGLASSTIYPEIADLQHRGILVSSSPVQKRRVRPQHPPQEQYELSSEHRRAELQQEVASFLATDLEETGPGRRFATAQGALMLLIDSVLDARSALFTDIEYETWANDMRNRFLEVGLELQRSMWESTLDFSTGDASQHPFAVAVRLHRRFRKEFEEQVRSERQRRELRHSDTNRQFESEQLPQRYPDFEQTIRTPVECSGVGLHSGAPVNLRILPAAAGTGIVFRRTDLDGFELQASLSNVARVSYALSIMSKGVLVSTVEHFLSACFGVGLDNAIVELDNLELPSFDGSAQPFVDLLLKAQLVQQSKGRSWLRILREVELREGDKLAAVYPSDTCSVFCRVALPLEDQRYEIDLSPNLYYTDIAGARNYRLLSEEQMKNMGLIRGASDANMIAFADDGMPSVPLRFPNEFVRHEILNLIGVMGLLRRRIIGRFVSDGPSHAMHTALMNRLARDKSLWKETTTEANLLSDTERIGASSRKTLR